MHRQIYNVLKGWVAAFHDHFCPPFGPERGAAALKMAKNDIFLVKFSDQRGGGVQPQQPSP